MGFLRVLLLLLLLLRMRMRRKIGWLLLLLLWWWWRLLHSECLLRIRIWGCGHLVVVVHCVVVIVDRSEMVQCWQGSWRRRRSARWELRGYAWQVGSGRCRVAGRACAR